MERRKKRRNDCYAMTMNYLLLIGHIWTLLALAIYFCLTIISEDYLLEIMSDENIGKENPSLKDSI